MFGKFYKTRVTKLKNWLGKKVISSTPNGRVEIIFSVAGLNRQI